MRISDWSSDVCSSDLRLAQLQGGLRIVVNEHLLHRRAVGPVFQQQVSERQIKDKQTAGEWHLAVSFYLTVGDVGEAITVRSYDAPASGAKRSEERRVGKECVSKGRFRGEQEK